MIQLRRRQALAALSALAACTPSRSLRVILPAPPSLDPFVFWVALGSGATADEDLTITLDVAPAHAILTRFVADEQAVALLPSPLLFELVAEAAPVRAFASLLERDLHHLVVPTALVDHAPVSLGERLGRMRGRTIGVAAEAERRLRALLAVSELPPTALAQIGVVRLAPHHLNAALGAGRVDGLFVASPQLERALVRQGAAVLAAAAEAPALANLQLMSVVAHRPLLDADDRRLVSLIGALSRALTTSRRDPSQAASAILTVLDRAPAEIEPIAALYATAVPATLVASTTRLFRAARLFPGAAPIPASPQALEPFVDLHLVPTLHADWPALVAPIAAAATATATAIALRRRAQRPERQRR